MVNKSIFKAYDVRGIYPADLNKEAATKIGRAFVRYTGAKNIVVCQDARLSSPELFRALCKGLLAEGAKVTSIGQMPTECLYFAVGNYDFDGGIMITASHNPKEYNGFKMMKLGKEQIEWIRGVDLLPIVEVGDFPKKEVDEKIIKNNIVDDYINYIFNLFDFSEIKKLKVIVDASNGVVGNTLSKIKMPVEIIPLNFKPDGNFPNHSPNPLEPGASDQISAEIKKQKADFGFMFDGDADRIFLVDEKGDLVSADVARLVLAKHFLKKNSKAVIVHDAICSRAVPELIKKWDGVPVRSEVGFVNIREALIKNKGIMGGELSSHYCFRDYFYMDSGLVAFLLMLQEISLDGRKVSEIVKELTLYAKSPTINFEVKDKDAVLSKIKEKYKDGNQDFLDGVTVEYEDWWFNVRASNTEPLLRLTIEANTQELLEEKKSELSEVIKNEA